MRCFAGSAIQKGVGGSSLFRLGGLLGFSGSRLLPAGRGLLDGLVFAFGQSLPISLETLADRQREDFGRGPPGVCNHDA